LGRKKIFHNSLKHPQFHPIYRGMFFLCSSAEAQGSWVRESGSLLLDQRSNTWGSTLRYDKAFRDRSPKFHAKIRQIKPIFVLCFVVCLKLEIWDFEMVWIPDCGSSRSLSPPAKDVLGRGGQNKTGPRIVVRGLRKATRGEDYYED